MKFAPKTGSWKVLDIGGSIVQPKGLSRSFLNGACVSPACSWCARLCSAGARHVERLVFLDIVELQSCRPLLPPGTSDTIFAST